MLFGTGGTGCVHRRGSRREVRRGSSTIDRSDVGGGIDNPFFKRLVVGGGLLPVAVVFLVIRFYPLARKYHRTGRKETQRD